MGRWVGPGRRAGTEHERRGKAAPVKGEGEVGGATEVSGRQGVSIRDEVEAWAAARHALGPGYDTAVAEGLVERIGEEIDRRVDARLFGQAQYPSRNPLPLSRRGPAPGRLGFGAVALALGSMALAIGATAAELHPRGSAGQVNGGQGALAARIWLLIAGRNIYHAPRR